MNLAHCSSTTDELTEAALHSCSYKKMLWKYAANVQENTLSEVRFQEGCQATLLKSHFGMGVLL